MCEIISDSLIIFLKLLQIGPKNLGNIILFYLYNLLLYFKYIYLI